MLSTPSWFSIFEMILMSLWCSSRMSCTAFTSAAERTNEWAMKSMSCSMASRMLSWSFFVMAGRSMCSPGTFTLLWAPSTPSFCTSAMTIGPSQPVTFMSISPSSNRMSSPTFTSLAKSGYDTFRMSWVELISGRPKMRTVSPALYSMGSSTPVVRTSGPLVSIMRARCGDTSRTFFMMFFMPSGVAWAVFMRTTFTPAKNNLRMNSLSHLLSLIEATILVCFIVFIS